MSSDIPPGSVNKIDTPPFKESIDSLVGSSIPVVSSPSVEESLSPGGPPLVEFSSSAVSSTFPLLASEEGCKEGVMISSYIFSRIRQLSTEGKNISQIACQLRIDRKTVRKYLRSNTPPKYKPRESSTREDPFEGYASRTEELLENNQSNTAREIYELLVDEGYKGSERTVHRRVRDILGSRPKERFFEQQYEPGEQSQFDFKERVPLPFVGGERIVHLHFGTLPHSNNCLVRGYPSRNYECFIDGIHSFFEGIGGMTENIRIDNLSPCVKKVLKGNQRVYTQSFQEAIQHYGFKVLPCSPGKGSEKGDVERDIRTFASRIQNFVKNKGVIFKDWDHLNNFLKNYMAQHQNESAKSLFKEEVKALKPLPPRDEDILCKVDICRSNNYGTLRVAKSTYSIPDEIIKVPCKVVSGPYDVMIYRLTGRKEFLACHPRKSDGENSILLEHILPSLVRKPQAMVRWVHRPILFPTNVCKSFYQRLKQQDPSSCEREYLKVINLIQHVSWQDLSIAMELQLESNETLSFEIIKELLLGCSTQVSDISYQQPLQPQLSQYDSLIPKEDNYGT